MSKYTTEELIKSNRLCASGDCGSECYFYIYDEFCQDELKAHSAERLESQQKEIAELKKQIADYDLNGQIRARDESLKRRKEWNVLLEEKIEKLKWDNAALEATVENQRKQISETYTAEQYQKDVNRMYGVDDAFGSKNTPEQMREWAKSHPEPPKISNGDKFREVFGDGTLNICFKPRNVKCSHIGDIECDACDYGINGAYKQPSDK